MARIAPSTGHAIVVTLVAALLLQACATRDLWQKPQVVVDLLEIPAGSTVADIGAGDGYFIPYLAQAVGPDGRVYAVDVDPEKIRGLEMLVAERKFANVEVVLAQFDDPLLPDGEIDLVVLVNTYHHIEDRPSYFSKLRAADLSSSGRVAVIEPNGDAGGVVGLLVEAGHTSTASAVRDEMSQAGYTTVATYDPLPVQIFEIFIATDPRRRQSE
jgi:predicted methyltransferase